MRHATKCPGRCVVKNASLLIGVCVPLVLFFRERSKHLKSLFLLSKKENKLCYPFPIFSPSIKISIPYLVSNDHKYLPFFLLLNGPSYLRV